MNIRGNSMHIGLYAIIFGLLYWPVETVIHVAIFDEGTFFDLFFTPEIHEAWMRLLVSFSFIAFGLYAHRAIRQQQQLNGELARQQNRTRSVIETAYDAYVAINAESVITDWNPRAEKMFGWSHSDAIGKTLMETIVPERFHRAHAQGMRNYLKGGSGPWLYRTVTTTARHKHGNEFEIEMAIIPLSGGNEQEFYAFIRKTAEREDE